MRGASVGACSAAVAIAAHGAAGGSLPTGPALVLLGLVATALGAVVAGFRIRPAGSHFATLTAAMCVGQTAGHITLTAVAGHHHESAPAVPMLAAHLGAALLCALLTVLAEQLYRTAVSVLTGLAFMAAPPATGRRSLLIPPHSTHLRIQLLASGRGTRGPPAAALAIS